MGEKGLVFRVIELEDEIKTLRFAMLDLIKYEDRIIYEAGLSAAIHLADKPLGGGNMTRCECGKHFETLKLTICKHIVKDCRTFIIRERVCKQCWENHWSKGEAA